MEVQKEAFSGLMEYYKLLPTKNKRNEIVNILEELISYYSIYVQNLEYFLI